MHYTQPMESKERIITCITNDRVVAHDVFFAHRLANQRGKFQEHIIRAFSSKHLKVLIEAFRGAGKSTIAEDDVSLMICMREFKNGLIIGSSYERAVERLTTIKNEITTNTALIDVFGFLEGSTWKEGKVLFSNGVFLQAYGRGQSLRGVKHMANRPDFCLVDDLEDEESVETPAARDKLRKWFMKVLLPALDAKPRIRFVGTPLHPESLICHVEKDAGWKKFVFPIEYLDTDGNRAATWPDRFPISSIDEIMSTYQRMGMMNEYVQEYMCKADSEAERAFHSAMIKVEPIVRTWQPTYAFYDPARTVGVKSAHTGVGVWSWVNNRLIKWDGYGRNFLPDEMIDDMFRLNEEFHPIHIGVEQDGLEEWLLQPLRSEQRRRGVILPIKAVRAPRGKLSFIKAMQPYYNAGEVTWAKEMPDLREQLLNFPTGKIDVPNAFAYALRMHPGKAIYEDFSVVNIEDDLQSHGSAPFYLATNATDQMVTAALVQFTEGCLRVHADWVLEGGPSDVLRELLEEANLVASRQFKLYAPEQHFDLYRNVGLRQLATRLGYETKKGNGGFAGREAVKVLLKNSAHGIPSMRVSSQARWTLNAFSGGYARKINSDGTVSGEANEGAYRVLTEGLEAFCGVMNISAGQQERGEPHYAMTKGGVRYMTSRPSRYNVYGEV